MALVVTAQIVVNFTMSVLATRRKRMIVEDLVNAHGFDNVIEDLAFLLRERANNVSDPELAELLFSAVDKLEGAAFDCYAATK
jgi:hypothetical protein